MKSKETAKLLGIRKSCLRFYCSKKLIRPSVDEKGQYDYSESDIRQLKQLLEYRAAGVSIAMLQEILKGALPPREALIQSRAILQQQIEESREALRKCEELLRRDQGPGIME